MTRYSRRVAFHESGHAVMAMLVGVELAEVSVSRRSGGVTRYRDPIDDPFLELPVLLGGRQAEAYGCGDVYEDGCRQDAANADSAAFEATGGDLVAADALRARVLEHVRDVLATHWSTVEALTEQLLQSPHGAILGADLNPTREVLTK